MTKKLTSLLIFVLLTTMLFSACGTTNTTQPDNSAPADSSGPASQSAAPEKKFTIKFAGIKTEDDPATLALKRFAESVNNNPDANITVKTFPNSVLGSVNDMLSGMPTGITDMFYNTLSCYSWLEGAKKFNAVTAPFIWNSHEELQAFLESDTAKQWFDEAAEASGVRVIAAAGELPPRQLTADRPIKSAADFKGLKIRTAESALVQQTMKKLGATPVVIPFADLYMALRQGTVDAQENNFITVKNNSLFEVQKYFMKTDYIRDVSSIFISENLWKQLSPNQQDILQKAALDAVNFEAEKIAASMDETMDFLNQKMTFVEVDVKSVQDKLGADIYKEFDEAGELWPAGTIDKILEFKANYEKK